MKQNRAVRATISSLAGLSWFGFSSLAARSARADVTSCVQWHASGQREAKAGHLKLASQLFTSCGSSEECPSEIRAECVDFYAAVERSVPTVIFTASDENGHDLTAVRVYTGEELVTEDLDGRALPLDPGKYEFRFVTPEGVEAKSEVLVREGEKNRVISVRVRASSLALSAVASSRGDALSPKRGALPTGFWISTGVGVAALASWGAFALLGHGQQSTLDACSPTCSASKHGDFDAMRTDYLIADVSLGIALASAGAATYFLLSRPHDKAEARVALVPAVSTKGGALLLRARAF